MEEIDIKDIVRNSIRKSLEVTIFDIVNGAVREILKRDEVTKKIKRFVEAELNKLLKESSKQHPYGQEK